MKLVLPTSQSGELITNIYSTLEIENNMILLTTNQTEIAHYYISSQYYHGIKNENNILLQVVEDTTHKQYKSSGFLSYF